MAQSAVAHGLQDTVQFLDLGEIVGRAVAVVELVHQIAQQRGADAAGRAKAAALMGEEMDEIARHLEHVAAVVEHHEGAGGRDILEARCGGRIPPRAMHTPDGPLTCTACTSLGAAGREHLAHAHAERILVKAGPGAVAGDAQNLGAGGCAGADACIPGAAAQGDRGRTRRRSRHCSPPSADRGSRGSPETAAGCAACRACLRATRSAPIPRRRHRRRHPGGFRCRNRSPCCPSMSAPSSFARRLRSSTACR